MPDPSQPTYDLVLAGGSVLDPASGTDGVLDVAVADGKIAAIGADLASRAREVVDCSGKTVLPGLVEGHTHIFQYVSKVGAPPEEAHLRRGVVAAADAGTAGASTFPAFRKLVVEPTNMRIVNFLNVSVLGLIDFRFGELLNPNTLVVDDALEVAASNPDIVRGFKIRLSEDVVGEHWQSLLKKSVALAEQAGLPLMVHIGETEEPLPIVLEHLRAGDVVAHCYTGKPNGILDGETVHPAVQAARDRGVLFDSAHGRSNLSFEVARRAIADGFLPDVLQLRHQRPQLARSGLRSAHQHLQVGGAGRTVRRVHPARDRGARAAARPGHRGLRTPRGGRARRRHRRRTDRRGRAAGRGRQLDHRAALRTDARAAQRSCGRHHSMERMSARSQLRAALAQGRRVVGTFVKLPTVDAVELARAAGFDFVVVDLEHSALSESEAITLVRHASVLGLPATVRLPRVDAATINRLLENGAAGIQLSMLRTTAQRDELLSATRYAPGGTRSISLAHHSAGFGAEGLAAYLQGEADDPPILIGQIETASTDPFEALLPGLDVCFVGTTDLTVDLGDAPVAAAVARIADSAKGAGVAFGGWAPSVPAAADLGLADATYLVVGSDLQILAAGLRRSLHGT